MELKQYQYYYGIAYRLTDAGKTIRSGYFKDWYNNNLIYFKNYNRTSERRLNMKEYRKTHLGEVHKSHLTYNQKIKYLVIEHYSNGTMLCRRCGFSDMRALSIDHIDGNGSNHRKNIKKGIFYGWLKANGFPEGYQVLCMNCQFIKRAENGEHRWKTSQVSPDGLKKHTEKDLLG